MTMEKIMRNNMAAVVFEGTEVVIWDTQSALDLMMTVQYETGCSRLALPKQQIAEAFFDLRTGLAGEILQKFVNYRMKLAIYGDFSVYTSKALRDFIYESNQGRDICFASDRETALDWLLRSDTSPTV